MKCTPRIFQYPIVRANLRKFEKTGIVSPGIIRLENRILNELAQKKIDAPINSVYSTHLYLRFDEKGFLRSNFASARLLKSVVATRGRLRWLCLRLMPKIFSNSFEIGRGKLILHVLLNWKTFRDDVLGKLFTTETLLSSVMEIDSYEYTHPNMEFEFTTSQVYLLGEELGQSLNYRFGRNLKKEVLHEYLLGRLIFRDSSAVLKLFRQREHFFSQAPVLSFIEHFPEFKTIFSRQAKIQVKINPKAGLTFDERIEYGQTSPEVLQNVAIWHQRFIIQEETWHVIDSTTTPYSDFVAGHWQFLESVPDYIDHVYLKRPQNFNQVNLKQAIFLLGRADENWYHLLLDTLPRYLQLRSIDAGVPVLIRSDLPETTLSIIRSLISRTIVFVSPKDLVSVDRLFFISARSTVHDSKPTNGEDQVKFSPQALKDLREWILSRLDSENDEDLPTEIFIPRRAKYRNLINARQLQNILETFGFHTLETNQHFYLKQHAYFNQANHVVSPGGAVLANLVFMRPGSKVLIIRSWRDSDLLLWNKLAAACELDFYEVVGIPTYYGRKALARQHSNFFLPIRRVRKILKS